MSCSASFPVRAASIVVALGLAVGLSACTGGAGPSPSGSASGSASASTGTRTPSASPVPGSGGTGAAAESSATPLPGTGNGSGVEDPDEVDFARITAQGRAASGGGTVVSISGSGDSWTVVAVGPDGSQTQAVVSATLDRVTSGPFPKQVDAATQASLAALAAAVRTDAGAAATAAEDTVRGGRLRTLVLGGSASAPVWTATVDAGGSTRTVTVDGTTGAATAG